MSSHHSAATTTRRAKKGIESGHPIHQIRQLRLRNTQRADRSEPLRLRPAQIPPLRRPRRETQRTLQLTHPGGRSSPLGRRQYLLEARILLLRQQRRSVPTQRPVCRNQRRHLERAPPEPSPATLRELPIRLHIGSTMSPGAAPEPDERIVGQRRRAVRAAQLVRCQPVAKLIPDQAGQTRRQTRIRIHLRLPQQPQPQPGAGNSTGCVRVIRPDLIPVVKRHPQATLRQPLHRLHTTRDGPRQPPRSQTQRAKEQATLPHHRRGDCEIPAAQRLL